MTAPTFGDLAEHVDDLAASATVARGRAYHLRGRVLRMVVGGVNAVASVRGSRGRDYTVSVTILSEGTVRAHCDCPHAALRCKHVIAVVLAAAAEEAPRAGAGAAAAAVSRPDPASRTRGSRRVKAPRLPSLALDMARNELQAWARQHGLQVWLRAVARVSYLPEEPGPGARAWVRPHSEASLSTLVLGADIQHYYWRPAVAPQGLRDAALKLLEALPTETAAAEEAHQRWLQERQAPPPGPRRTLWEALDRLRGALEKRTRRVPPRGWGGAWTVALDEGPPAMVLTPARGPLCPQGRRRALHLTASQQGAEVTVLCSQACSEGECPLRLAATDEALRQLAAPAPAAAWARWAELATAAPWERLVARVHAALRGPDAAEGLTLDGVPAELGWRVSTTWDGVELDPVLLRPRKGNTKGVVVRKAPWESVLRWQNELPLPQDRQALLLAVGGERMGGVPVELVLGALTGHPRVFWREERRGQGLGPIEVRNEPAELVVARGPDGEVEPRLRLGSRQWPLEALEALDRDDDGPMELEGCLVQIELQQGWVAVHPVPPSLQVLLDELRRGGGVALPAAAGPALVEALTSAPAPPPCTIDATLAGAAIPPDCTPLVQLTVDSAGSLDVELRCRPLAGGASQTPGEGRSVLYATLNHTPQHCRRDLDAERKAARALALALDLPAEATAEIDPAAVPYAWHVEELEPALGLLERLQTMDSPPAVEWLGQRRYAVSSSPDASGLRVRVKRHRDWFGLTGALDTGDSKIPLAGLLAAIRERRAFVEVGPDQWVRLADGLRRALGPASRARARAGGEVELSRFACAELERLEEAGAAVEQPPAWRLLRERMREAASLEPAIPSNLQATLRGYQREGFAWLMRLAHWGAGGCLADDMGLGKTVQALAVLLARAETGPALVLAPTSVGHNWIREGERFAPSLKLLPFRGRAERERLSGLAAGQVLVTSYDLAARYADELSQTEFATLVLDEAQAIKNPSTQRAKAVFGLRADVRLALTGTPLENRTGELWSLFRALLPGLLGSERSFRELYATPIERDADEHARDALAQRVRPFILRRLKQEVAPELPPRSDVQVDVELGLEQRRLYERLRQATLAELTKPKDEQGPTQQRRFRVLAALTRLRQLACHPQLCDPDSRARSAKLDSLLELLQEVVAEGHSALVFSQFTTLLAIVREALDRVGITYRYLDGSTPASKRAEEIDAFQGGAAPVFLLSLKAGGMGINLTAADYVFHLDPWWNPAVEDQATDRAHRIGQQRPVTVLRLVAKDTVEDTILALHADKRELVERLLDGTNSASPLGTEELLALLEHGVAPAPQPDETTPRRQRAGPRPAGAQTYLAAPTAAPQAATPQAAAPAATPQAAAPAATPQAAAATGGEALLSSLDTVLRRARADGALATDIASRAYRRVGGRIVAFAGDRGLSLARPDLPETVETYRAAIKSGEGPGPSSDYSLARSTLGWLQQAADETT